MIVGDLIALSSYYITHVNADEQPLTRDTQKITQRVNQNKDKPIESWLSTVPLSLENLVDPFQKRKSENMPPNAGLSSHVGPISTRITPSAGTKHTPSVGGVRATDFRDSLCEHNIFINDTDASKELMEGAKKIITDKELFPEMNDAHAQELAVTAQNLETGTKDDIVEELGGVLIPTKVSLPHQYLQRISNRLWSNAVEIPPDPDELAMPPILPKPKPDLVFGYSKIAFNNNQLKAMKLLKGQLRENYAMPDGKVRFPFLVIEFKSQAAGGTHFTATNQLANAGAVAMEGTLQLARRISAGETIDFDQPQFFSLSIDHSTANVNVHWLSRNDENGAFCFNMKHLLQRFLDADGLKAVDRAVKGILHYGVNKRLKKIRRELDTFAQNILKEKAIIEKGNLASGAPPGEQQQQQQPGKRKNDDSLTNRQQAPLQIKRPCRAQESIADDEDELA